MLARARAAARRAAARRGARLRRHQLDARRRARRGAGGHPGRARRGGHALVRPDDARGAQPRADRPPGRRCCCAPPRPPRPTSRAESVAGRVEVVGDVMVDVRPPLAAGRARGLGHAPRPRRCEPGSYLLLTAHRAGNVDDPARLRALVELIEALPTPVAVPAAPAHARPAGERRACSSGSERDRRPRADRAARLRRVQRAALPGARGPDGLRGRPEGGVPCRGALRDAASEHRVGGDRGGGLEHARRPRRPGRAGRARARAPGGAARALRRRPRGRAVRAGDRRVRRGRASAPGQGDERDRPCAWAWSGSATGARTSRATSPRSRAASSRWLCDASAEAREKLPRSFPAARATGELSRPARGPRARRDRARHAGAHPRRAGGRGGRGGQALLRREAARHHRRRRRTAVAAASAPDGS